MRIAIEFDSAEEAIPFLQSMFPTTPSAPHIAPPVSNASVAAGAEQFSEPAQPAKRKRRTNAEIAAAEAATKPAEPTTAQASEFEDEPGAQTQASDFLDDDAPPAAPVKATKDDVRAALVGYQERLTGAGTALEAARATVLGLLKKVSGADKLGACPEDKFAAVIAAANAAK